MTAISYSHLQTAATLEFARARGALGGAAAASRSGSVVDTVRHPPLGASVRHYRVSAASRSAPVGDAAAAAAAAAAAPSPPPAAAPAPAAPGAASGGSDKAPLPAVLVKVGESGKWRSFKHAGLLGMDASDLLQALADSKVFGADLKDVKLSACTVAVHKLPSGTKVLTAAKEKDAKFEELEGAMTVEDTTASIAGEQVCIRVQLPGPAGASREATPGAAAAGTWQLPITFQHRVRAHRRCVALFAPHL